MLGQAPLFWNLLVIAFFGFGVFIAIGSLRRATANLDELWSRYEQLRRSEGFPNPQRTPEWERQTRNGAYVGVAFGAFFALMALGMLATGNSSRPSSFPSTPERVWVE